MCCGSKEEGMADETDETQVDVPAEEPEPAEDELKEAEEPAAE